MRLDEWLCQEHDLDLSAARSYILRGHVTVNGQKVTHSGYRVRAHRDSIHFRPPDARNRGRDKLLPVLHLIQEECALEGRPPPWSYPCLDIGASHGGFCQALLEVGARRIFAVDVAYGIFDYELRNRPEIHLLERKSIRQIHASWFEDDFLSAEKIFIVCDVSFLSLRLVLQSLLDFFRKEKRGGFEGLFLLKHQFEVPDQTDRGILRDDNLRRSVQEEFEAYVSSSGMVFKGSFPSGLAGRKGNRETFLWIEYIRPQSLSMDSRPS